MHAHSHPTLKRGNLDEIRAEGRNLPLVGTARLIRADQAIAGPRLPPRGHPFRRGRAGSIAVLIMSEVQDRPPFAGCQENLSDGIWSVGTNVR